MTKKANDYFNSKEFKKFQKDYAKAHKKFINELKKKLTQEQKDFIRKVRCDEPV